MVVETRRGKRKDNPAKEKTRRVKLAKETKAEASDNIEKTTEMTVIVESTGQTRETSEDSKEITAEKTSEDSREIPAGTEPTEVALETAPTTVNKGTAGPSPPAPPATPAIGTHSGDEENDDDNEGSEEGNGDGDGEGKDDENGGSEDEASEDKGSEEENGDGVEKDDDNEGSEDENGDGVEKDDDNEGSDEENGDTEEELANENDNENPPQVINSIIPTRTPQEERLLDEILEDEDDVDKSDIAMDSWMKCLDTGEKFLKRTMRLLRTVDKKVDQLDGRLAPLEEFVKEAQGKTAEVDEAESQGKGKSQKRKKSLGKGKKQKS
ncbi:hypothetical protein Bca4012_062763 [Brassica carinata]